MTGRSATGKIVPSHPMASLFHLSHPSLSVGCTLAAMFSLWKPSQQRNLPPCCLRGTHLSCLCFYCWEYRKQWGCWRRYLFWSQTEKSGWFRGQRWQFLNMVWLTHARRCSEFPLFCGRLGQTWPDWSFFEAPSNARKTTPAALLRVEGALKGNSKIQRI